ncbi:MAG: EAL domain-containing protein [Acidimicrobiales bacterium]
MPDPIELLVPGLRALAGGDVESPHEILGHLVSAARLHLGMDVGFISEFVDGERVFRHVDVDDPGSGPVRVGDGDPLEDTYCQRVVDGRLPELIHDAQNVAAAVALSVTSELPVGAHISVPLRLADGRLYGTFCCFSSAADSSLSARDVDIVRMFADVAARYVAEDLRRNAERSAAQDRVTAALDDESGTVMEMVYQPIVDLSSGDVCGVEALARFRSEPYRSPDVWFSEAASIGRGVDLEVTAVRLALTALAGLPEPLYLSVNVSAETVVSAQLDRIFTGVDATRIVLEVTEHAVVDDYDGLTEALGALQARGVRLAVDDAGAGYASLRHILMLNPHFIKLDMSITRDIDSDVARAALAAALVHFGHRTGSRLIAEGVETASELEAVKALGVHAAQGYILGRPGLLADAVTARA